MTGQLLFVGRAFLDPNPVALGGWLDYLPDSERFRSTLPGPREMLREHTRLFFSPAGAPCPPWQSVHSNEPTIMGPTHHSALAWFRAAGIEPATPNEPADHIGLLLSFYAKLVEDEAEPETIALFRDQHLRWIPAFCEVLEEKTTLPFYRELARQTREILLN